MERMTNYWDDRDLILEISERMREESDKPIHVRKVTFCNFN